MKTNKLLLPLVISYTMLFGYSCSEEKYNDYYLQKGNKMLFKISTNRWGQDCSIKDIETEGNFCLTAISGDNFGEIKSRAKRVKAETRAALQDNIAVDDNFYLAAYYKQNEVEKTFISPQQTECKDPDNNVYWSLINETEDTKYWKLGSQAIYTYAWWPNDLTFSEEEKSIVNYEVQDDVINQKDLLYSYVKPTYYTTESSAEIQFNHALTAVQFVMAEGFSGDGGIPVKIAKIELENLYYKGNFNLETGVWDVDKSITKTFVLECPDEADDVPYMTAESENLILNPGRYTFLMMPQDLSETPCVAVFTLSDGNIFRATLNHAGIWETGQSVRYLLKGDVSNGYVIYASSQEAPYTGSDGTDETQGSISVTSYRLVGNTPIPQRWKVTGFSIDEGKTWNETNATTWTGWNVEPIKAWCRIDEELSPITGISESATDAKTINFIVDKSVMTKGEGMGEQINNDLYTANAVSNYDLSMHTVAGGTCSMTTANCYIVHAPGTYKFPAVYGNAMKNGSANTNAYSPSNFVNYKGVTIGSPYIYNDTDANGTSGNKLVPVSARVIWEDGAIEGAITDVSYSEGYISFNVNREYIYQGNAVIGLFDVSGTCMWSWHIWVTTAYMKEYEDAYRKLKHVTLNGSTMAPCPVGTVFIGRTATYGNRAVMLQIKQTDDEGNVLIGASTCKVYLSQGSGKEETQYVSSVSYPWGRKDPQPTTSNWQRPSNYTIEKNPETGAESMKQVFPTAYYEANSDSKALTGYDWDELGTQCSMAETIKYPQLQKRKYDATPNYDWCYLTYYNWWNASASSANTYTKVTKTIYDPSPAGYAVLHYNALNSTIISSSGAYNTIYNEKGTAICNWRDFSGLIFYYSGYYYRHKGNAFMTYLNESGVWFSHATDASMGGRIRCQPKTVYYNTSQYRSSTEVVHPVKE